MTSICINGTLSCQDWQRGTFSFFMRPDQPMQFIAVEDIGRVIAAIFTEPAKLGSQNIEIAGDTVTGTELADEFSLAAGCPITDQHFPDRPLEHNALLGSLARLVDQGRLAGHADLSAFHKKSPGLLTLRQ